MYRTGDQVHVSRQNRINWQQFAKYLYNTYSNFRCRNRLSMINIIISFNLYLDTLWIVKRCLLKTKYLVLGMSKDNEERGDVWEFKKREHNERYLFILCYILEKVTQICFLSWYILTYFSLVVDNQYLKKDK